MEKKARLVVQRAVCFTSGSFSLTDLIAVWTVRPFARIALPESIDGPAGNRMQKAAVNGPTLYVLGHSMSRAFAAA